MQIRTAKKLNTIPLIIFFFLFFALASVFVYFGVKLVNQEIPEDFVETKATIVDIQETYSFDDITYIVYIDYEYGGQTYSTIEFGQYDSSMKVGDEVTIFVNPASPEEFMTDGNGGYIFLIISSVFAVIGLGGLIYNVKKLVDMKKASQEEEL